MRRARRRRACTSSCSTGSTSGRPRAERRGTRRCPVEDSHMLRASGILRAGHIVLLCSGWALFLLSFVLPATNLGSEGSSPLTGFQATRLVFTYLGFSLPLLPVSLAFNMLMLAT